MQIISKEDLKDMGFCLSFIVGFSVLGTIIIVLIEIFFGIKFYGS